MARVSKLFYVLACTFPLACQAAGLPPNDAQTALQESVAETKHLPLSTRIHWMRIAKQALFDLVSPCPFQAYGTAIVNHTSTHELGDLICLGANANIQTGNPTLHGEIAAITNCTAILTDPHGPYALSPDETTAAFRDFTLYTTAEACPMCASAIRWAGFKGYVYATSIDTLIERGWAQIKISSQEVFAQSGLLGPVTEIIGDILTNETDPLLSWQFQPGQPCPTGCWRDEHQKCDPNGLH